MQILQRIKLKKLIMVKKICVKQRIHFICQIKLCVQVIFTRFLKSPEVQV